MEILKYLIELLRQTQKDFH